MPLDPEVRKLLDEARAAGLRSFDELSVAEARAQLVRASEGLRGPDLEQVEDHQIPGPAGTIPLRLYRPDARARLPAIVYYHGGGWVVGNIQTHDAYCRSLAHACRTVVVSVDYRLAPEARYPAAVEDAYAAVGWLFQQAAALGLDDQRLAVAGDSAGGNLATVVSMMARDQGTPPVRCQILIYPITDCAFETPSYHEFADGYHLTRDTMRWFWSHYLGAHQQADDAYASPLRASDLRGLPPALVLTAECDPLRDEGEAYAQRLADSGVPVCLVQYQGMIHGFVRRTGTLALADRALDDVARYLTTQFAPEI